MNTITSYFKMNIIEEAQEIGPAVKGRFKFSKGEFLIQRSFLTWTVSRADTYIHQVRWLESNEWVDTFEQTFTYPVVNFTFKKKAEQCLQTLEHCIKSTDNLIPKYLGCVVEYLSMHSFSKSRICAEMKKFKNQLKHERNS